MYIWRINVEDRPGTDLTLSEVFISLYFSRFICTLSSLHFVINDAQFSCAYMLFNCIDTPRSIRSLPCLLSNLHYLH